MSILCVNLKVASICIFLIKTKIGTTEKVWGKDEEVEKIYFAIIFLSVTSSTKYYWQYCMCMAFKECSNTFLFYDIAALVGCLCIKKVNFSFVCFLLYYRFCVTRQAPDIAVCSFFFHSIHIIGERIRAKNHISDLIWLISNMDLSV